MPCSSVNERAATAAVIQIADQPDLDMIIAEHFHLVDFCDWRASRRGPPSNAQFPAAQADPWALTGCRALAPNDTSGFIFGEPEPSCYGPRPPVIEPDWMWLGVNYADLRKVRSCREHAVRFRAATFATSANYQSV